MTFARRVFLAAAVYGFVVLVPQYFMEGKIGRDFPPPISHPEYFYGFVGVAIAWQIVFVMISTNPERFRPLMLVSIVEKAAFAVPAAWLFALGRLNGQMLAAGTIDALLGTLFAISYVKTGRERER